MIALAGTSGGISNAHLSDKGNIVWRRKKPAEFFAQELWGTYFWAPLNTDLPATLLARMQRGVAASG